jgi:hypothetical protein
MLKLSRVGKSGINPFPAWPSLRRFEVSDKEKLRALLEAPSQTLRAELAALRTRDADAHAAHVMSNLCVLYAFYFDYIDAPDLTGVEDGEAHLVRVKKILEDEMVFHIFELGTSIAGVPDLDQAEASNYLEHLSLNNPGVNHPLFDYIAKEITPEQMKEFLWLEVIRNEVVDDEVAMLVPGLQHSMKQVVASNLWDECGNGRIDGFHTTWLVRLLSHKSEWEEFLEYRELRPWFSACTSNSFNSLLTNPANRFKAYGTFLINESWVADHFERILAGMDRVGILDEDRRIYFDAHYTIDKHHRLEMIEGLRQQVPALEPKRLREILEGAHQAIAAGRYMYDRLYAYFQAGGRRTAQIREAVE